MACGLAGSEAKAALSCGGWTRTNGLRVMSPVSYQLLHPTRVGTMATDLANGTRYALSPAFYTTCA